MLVFHTVNHCGGNSTRMVTSLKGYYLIEKFVLSYYFIIILFFCFETVSLCRLVWLLTHGYPPASRVLGLKKGLCHYTQITLINSFYNFYFQFRCLIHMPLEHVVQLNSNKLCVGPVCFVVHKILASHQLPWKRRVLSGAHSRLTGVWQGKGKAG